MNSQSLEFGLEYLHIHVVHNHEKNHCYNIKKLTPGVHILVGIDYVYPNLKADLAYLRNSCRHIISNQVNGSYINNTILHIKNKFYIRDENLKKYIPNFIFNTREGNKYLHYMHIDKYIDFEGNQNKIFNTFNVNEEFVKLFCYRMADLKFDDTLSV